MCQGDAGSVQLSLLVRTITGGFSTGCLCHHHSTAGKKKNNHVQNQTWSNGLYRYWVIILLKDLKFERLSGFVIWFPACPFCLAGVTGSILGVMRQLVDLVHEVLIALQLSFTNSFVLSSSVPLGKGKKPDSLDRCPLLSLTGMKWDNKHLMKP